MQTFITALLAPTWVEVCFVCLIFSITVVSELNNLIHEVSEGCIRFLITSHTSCKYDCYLSKFTSSSFIKMSVILISRQQELGVVIAYTFRRQLFH